MITYLSRRKDSWLFRLLSATSSLAFLFTLILPPTMVCAQGQPLSVLNLPVPGTMVLPTPGFAPALIKGLTVHPENPLAFDFVVDTGDSKLTGKALEEETSKLVRYFLATLTTPEENLWVNLSPYEKDRIIPEKFGETEMGRDLLAQDYILKQLMASMMYPEDGLGKEFWNRVYARAQQEFGTTKIPINTFNKVWIIPDEAVVVEYQGSAFVAKSHLKVMLEEDYLALAKNMDNKDFGIKGAPEAQVKDASSISSKVVKEILIPEIEKEVNQGKNFASLRQIYHSMILATWYKKNLKDSLLSRVYVDKNKIKGVDVDDKEIKQKIYAQYVEAFKKGVYNYIKKDIDPETKKPIARKYFSGGFMAAGQLSSPAVFRTISVNSPAEVSRLSPSVRTGLQSSSPIAQVGVVLGENETIARNSASVHQPLASPARYQLGDKIPADVSKILAEKLMARINDILEKTNLSATSTRARILNRRQSLLSNNEMTFEELLNFLDEILGLAKTVKAYQDAHDDIVRLLAEKPLLLTPYNPVSGYGQIVGTEYGPGVEDGQVTEIIQSGWLLQGEYFRKAEVIVADHSLDPLEAGEEYLRKGDLDNAAKMARILEEKNPSPETKSFSLRVDRAWQERESGRKNSPDAATAFSSPAGNWSGWQTIEQAGRKRQGPVFYGETAGLIQVRAGVSAFYDEQVDRKDYTVVAYYQFEPNDETKKVKVTAYDYEHRTIGESKYYDLGKDITFGNLPQNFQVTTKDSSLSGEHFVIFIGEKKKDFYPFTLQELGSLNGMKVRTTIPPSGRDSGAKGRLIRMKRLGTTPREGGFLGGQVTAGRVQGSAGQLEFEFVVEKSKPGQVAVTITNKKGERLRAPEFVPLGAIVVVGRESNALSLAAEELKSSSLSKQVPVHVIDVTAEDSTNLVSRVHFALQIQEIHEGVYELKGWDLKSQNNSKVYWDTLSDVEIAENNWDSLRKPLEWWMFLTQTEENRMSDDGVMAGFQLIYTEQGVITRVVDVNDNRTFGGEKSVIVKVQNNRQRIIDDLEDLPPLLKKSIQKYNQSLTSYSSEIVDANKSTLLEALRANTAANQLRMAFDKEGKISVLSADQPPQHGEVTLPVAKHYLFDMDFAEREKLPVNVRGAIEEFNDARKRSFRPREKVGVLFINNAVRHSLQFVQNRLKDDGYAVSFKTPGDLKEKLVETVNNFDVIVIPFDNVADFRAQMEVLQPIIHIFKEKKEVVVVVRPEDEKVLGEEARKKYLSEESVLLRAVNPKKEGEVAAKIRMIVDDLTYPSPFSSPAEEAADASSSSPAGRKPNGTNNVAARLLQVPINKKIGNIIQEKALANGLDKNVIVLEIRASDIGADGKIKENVIEAIRAQRKGSPGATIVVVQKRFSSRVGMDDRLNEIPVQGYFQYEGDIVTKKDLPELIVGALSGQSRTNGKGIWYFPPEQNETPLMKALTRLRSPTSNEVGEASPQAGSPVNGRTALSEAAIGYLKQMNPQHDSDVTKALEIWKNSPQVLVAIGEGDGRISWALADQNPGVGILATELFPAVLGNIPRKWRNRELLVQQPENNRDNYVLLRAADKVLEIIPDESLDFILAVNPHIDVLPSLFGHMEIVRQKLKPGGQFVIKFYMPTDQYTTAQIPNEKILKELQFLERKDVESDTKKTEIAGFRIAVARDGDFLGIDLKNPEFSGWNGRHDEEAPLAVFTRVDDGGEVSSPATNTDQPRQALATDAKAGQVEIMKKWDTGLGPQKKITYILRDSEDRRFVLIGLQNAMQAGRSWTLYHARPGSLGVEGPWVLVETDDNNVDLDKAAVNQVLSKIPVQLSAGMDEAIAARTKQDLGVINFLLKQSAREEFFLNTIAGLGEEISEKEWQRMVSWTNKNGQVFANVVDNRQTTWSLKIEAGTDERGPTLTYTLTVLININPEVPREKDSAWVLTIPGTRESADQKISRQELENILTRMAKEATYVPPGSTPASAEEAEKTSSSPAEEGRLSADSSLDRAAQMATLQELLPKLHVLRDNWTFDKADLSLTSVEALKGGGKKNARIASGWWLPVGSYSMKLERYLKELNFLDEDARELQEAIKTFKSEFKNDSNFDRNDNGENVLNDQGLGVYLNMLNAMISFVEKEIAKKEAEQGSAAASSPAGDTRSSPSAARQIEFTSLAQEGIDRTSFRKQVDAMSTKAWSLYEEIRGHVNNLLVNKNITVQESDEKFAKTLKVFAAYMDSLKATTPEMALLKATMSQYVNTTLQALLWMKTDLNDIREEAAARGEYWEQDEKFLKVKNELQGQLDRLDSDIAKFTELKGLRAEDILVVDNQGGLSMISLGATVRLAQAPKILKTLKELNNYKNDIPAEFVSGTLTHKVQGAWWQGLILSYGNMDYLEEDGLEWQDKKLVGDIKRFIVKYGLSRSTYLLSLMDEEGRIVYKKENIDEANALLSRVIKEFEGIVEDREKIMATLPSSPAGDKIENPGGINLDPTLMNLEIKRDKNWVPLPMDQQPPVENMNIEGFYPVIINVTPLPSLPILLGMEDGPAPDSAGKDNTAPARPQKLSLRALSPVDLKARICMGS